MSKELTNMQNTLLGCTAAFIEGIILQPTVYWKNARAIGLPFTLNPRVVYRGTVASMFNEMQMMGLQFGFTGFYEKRLSRNAFISKHDAHVIEVLSATLGGINAAFFASPVELIMIQQQLNGGSAVKSFVSIVKQGKIFRGLYPTIWRDAIYVTSMLGLTPLLQDYLVREKGLSVSTAGFYASLAGGIVAAIPSHPFDVVKTVMQAENMQLDLGNDVKTSKMKNMTQTAARLWRERGLRGFFPGASWRTFNITATIYIANECRVRMTPFFSTLEYI